MNLLLLLSALLSALSGVGGAVRPVAPQALAARIVGDVAVARVAPIEHLRPVQALPTRKQTAPAPHATALILAAVEPIFARRRRE